MILEPEVKTNKMVILEFMQFCVIGLGFSPQQYYIKGAV